MKPVVGMFGGLALAVVLARRTLTWVTVRGNSMAPTLADGQRVLAVRSFRYRRGDIVVFWTPGGRGTRDNPDYRVKRVVAVAGDPRPSWFAPSALPLVVPVGHVAIGGDGADSQDSTSLGYVPLAHIRGRALGHHPISSWFNDAGLDRLAKN
ncbi:MAG TPA: S26 family signal peptidase [Jatrophihabitans sp.]|nr:S26 family signal peptidase [Jatrophihabitans sp.]